MTHETIDLAQRSDEWLQARVGSLGASQLGDALARIKTGFGASRANLVAQLVVERLTGTPSENYINTAMQRGIDREPDARDAYEFARNVDVREVGLVRHPTIENTHASPDGLIGDDGMLEIKVPSSATHIDTLLTGTIPLKYLLQMHWQMIVCNRRWADYVSFDDRLPAHMQLFIKRVERPFDDDVKKLEQDVRDFLAEVDAKVDALIKQFKEAA